MADIISLAVVVAGAAAAMLHADRFTRNARASVLQSPAGERAEWDHIITHWPCE